MGSMLGYLTYFFGRRHGLFDGVCQQLHHEAPQKEFGLYQVLGMRRGRVATIMALETVIVSVGAFVAGIVLGVGLSQLMTFFTASLFKTQIANFHFFFSMHAFNLTLACMLVMFVLTLLLNLRAVRRTKLIELMAPSGATRASRRATLDCDRHLCRGRGAGGRGLLPPVARWVPAHRDGG